MDRRCYYHYDRDGGRHPHYIGNFLRDEEQPYDRMQPHFLRGYARSSDTGYPGIGRLSLQIPQDDSLSYGSAYSETPDSSIFEYDWGSRPLHANMAQDVSSIDTLLGHADARFRDAEGYSDILGYDAPGLDRLLQSTSYNLPQWAHGSEDMETRLRDGYPYFW